MENEKSPVNIKKALKIDKNQQKSLWKQVPR